MIIAQVVLVTPIIVSLCRESLETMRREYHDALRSLGATPAQAISVLVWDGRFTLATAHLAGFGRAIAEVGAVMIVGGNIDHVTPRHDHSHRIGSKQRRPCGGAWARRRAGIAVSNNKFSGPRSEVPGRSEGGVMTGASPLALTFGKRRLVAQWQKCSQGCHDNVCGRPAKDRYHWP